MKILNIKIYNGSEWVDYILSDSISELNLQNGEGLFSLQQKIDEAGDENHAYGMHNFIAGGHKNKTYQRNSTAIGGGNQAGLSEEEFNERYPDGIDTDNRPYSTSYGWAFAIGADNKALGKDNVLIGKANKSFNNHVYTFGLDNNQYGYYSFINGQLNNSYGSYNYITGYLNTIGEDKTRVHTGFIFGGGNTVKGATDFGSHHIAVVGTDNNVINSLSSVVIGIDNDINYGTGMTVIGQCLKRSFLDNGTDGSDNCMLLGKFNAQRSDITKSAALIVGAGTSEGDRKNVLEIYKDGRTKVFGAPVDDNDVVRKKELDDVTSLILGSEELNESLNTIKEIQDLLLSDDTIPGTDTGAIGTILDHQEKIYERLNIKDGQAVATIDGIEVSGGSIISASLYDDDRIYTSDELPIASGHEAIAFGKKCKATGKRSVAIGNGNTSSGNTSVVFGQTNTATGSASLTAGTQNINRGNYVFTIGLANETTEGTDSSIIVGRNNKLTNVNYPSQIGNALIGVDLTSDKYNQVVIGRSNIDTPAIADTAHPEGAIYPKFIIGNGIDENRSNAFEVYNDGRAKLYGTPIDDNDVITKGFIEYATENDINALFA